MPAVILRDVSKVYHGQPGGGVTALRRLNLEVGDGELLAVIGPSGSGKTTLLRLIAGLEEPTSGTLQIHGCAMAGVPPKDRDVAMVFQDHPLFPHLDVAGNLSFALGLRRLSAAEITARIDEVMTLLGLQELRGRAPASLSGGERQRVGIGAALARKPKVLLLDEPFGNLDLPLRLRLRTELKEIGRRLALTTVLVTHDQEEAFAMGARVAVVYQGELHQVASPEEVRLRPATVRVAEFLGLRR